MTRGTYGTGPGTALEAADSSTERSAVLETASGTAISGSTSPSTSITASTDITAAPRHTKGTPGAKYQVPNPENASGENF